MSRLVIDIGGTTTKLALATENLGEVTLSETAEWPTEYAYAECISEISARSKNLVGRGCREVCVAFGVSLSQGTVVAASKMPDFVGKNIRKDIQEVLGLPVAIAHDCIAATLAFVDPRGVFETTGYVTVSTGLGAAVAFHESDVPVLQRVRLAHHVVQLGGEYCACGRRGCLAAYVDSTRLKTTRGVRIEAASPQARDSYARVLAVGLGNFARMFSLRRLVVSGGVIRDREILSLIAGHFESETPADGYQVATLEMVEPDSHPPLRGAYRLADLGAAVIRG